MKAAKKDNKAEKAGKKVTKDIEYDEKVKDKDHGKKRGPQDSKAEKAGKKVTKDLEYDMKKKKKKKVKEGTEHKFSAARLEGKSHGLKGHAYCGKNYEDKEEARCYHQGYVEGLDECYGMGVYENAPATPAATVPGMADDAMGEEFLATNNYETTFEDDFMFESWDNELKSLLDEGVSIAVSKGQDNAPDSVNVNATDSDADKVLDFIKSAGLGVFSDSSEETMDASAEASYGDNSVVGDHDGMMDVMKKLSGISAGAPVATDEPVDFEDEEVSTDVEVSNTCDTCGDSSEDVSSEEETEEELSEVETEDQMEFEVSEDNAPDSDEEETAADEDAEAEEDKALSQAMYEGESKGEYYVDFDDDTELYCVFHTDKGDGKAFASYSDKGEATKDANERNSEKLDEWANDAGKIGTDQAFEQDIEFMTKVISGGLNKPKSTGQTTVPVIAGQKERMISDERNEAISEWLTLAGIKK